MGEELLVGPLLASRSDGGLDPLPYSEEFSARLEEQILVQQSIVKQCASLLPVAHHHHEVGPSFGPWSGDSHRFFPGVGEAVREEPIACLAETGFPPLLEDL